MAILRKVSDAKFCDKLEEHVGDGYVYGMHGQHNYSINDAISLEGMYGTEHPNSMGAGYYCVVENGKKNYYKGDCAKNYGHYTADCSGYIRWARLRLTGVDVSASANGVWGQCSVHGEISTLPHHAGVLLFRDTNDAGIHMGHVGVLVRDNKVIQAAGVKWGITKGALKKGWTHWGYADWIIYGTEVAPPVPLEDNDDPEPPAIDVGQSDDTVFNPKHVPYLAKGMKGAMVVLLQQRLVYHGLPMPASFNKRTGKYDGDFGAETLKQVKVFQTKWHLEVDGIVGAKTWSALMGYPCYK